VARGHALRVPGGVPEQGFARGVGRAGTRPGGARVRGKGGRKEREKGGGGKKKDRKEKEKGKKEKGGKRKRRGKRKLEENRKEEEKGKMGRRNGGRKKGKGERRKKRGDARRRYSRRRPRLVGHARAIFARCARRKKGEIASTLIAERRSRVVNRPPSGAGWDATREKRALILQQGGAGRQLESGVRMAANPGEGQGLGLN
jgi:hypothetical protein